MGDRQTGLNLILVFISCVFFKLLNSVFQFPYPQNGDNIFFFRCHWAMDTIQDNDCETLDTVVRTRLFWMPVNMGMNFALLLCIYF